MKEPHPAWITALFLHLNHYSRNIDATTVPTFILNHDGNEIWRHTGEITREDLLLKIQQIPK